jgi:hypothetical protein
MTPQARYRALRTIALVLPLCWLSACSGIPRQARDSERLERYQQYAGPPIDGFPYFSQINGWNTIDSTHVVVWTGASNAYLISVMSPCTDLAFADRIGLTKTAGQVTRLDSVIVRHWRCPIKEIRQFDYARMRQDMRKASEAAHQPGETHP